MDALTEQLLNEIMNSTMPTHIMKNLVCFYASNGNVSMIQQLYAKQKGIIETIKKDLSISAVGHFDVLKWCLDTFNDNELITDMFQLTLMRFFNGSNANGIHTKWIYDNYSAQINFEKVFKAMYLYDGCRFVANSVDDSKNRLAMFKELLKLHPPIKDWCIQWIHEMSYDLDLSGGRVCDMSMIYLFQALNAYL
jgi:hypothetical protein